MQADNDVRTATSRRYGGPTTLMHGDRGAAREERFHAIFSAIDEGFCLCEMIYDVRGRPIDYRFLEVNPLFESMTGLAGAVGRTALELVPDLEPHWIETYARVAAGDTLRFEDDSDAMARWFDVFAMPVGAPGRFAIVFKDITERRRAEEAQRLAASRDAFRAELATILRSITDPREAQNEAARCLVGHLGVAQAIYAEVDRQDPSFIVMNCDPDSDGPDGANAVRRHRLSDFGRFVRPILEAGEPLVLTDLELLNAVTVRERATYCALRISAHISAPIVRRGRLVAIMAVTEPVPREWSDHEVALVQEAADWTWAAVERAQAEEALRRSRAAERDARKRAELLTEMIGEVAAASGIDARARRLVELLVPALAEAAHISIADDTHEIVSVSRGRAGPDAETLVVPVDLGGGTTGELTASRAVYSMGQASAETLAMRAELLLTNARLWEEAHRVALRLQEALLPDALPVVRGTRIAARYLPGDEHLNVGGDWYDTVPLQDGRLMLVVGDVVGRGLEAAAAMGRLRTASVALAAGAASPVDLLERLDPFAQTIPEARHATTCCAILDPSTGSLRYAAAGHPPILVVEPDGHVQFLSGGRSWPLAGNIAAPRPEGVATLALGSTLVLYSDGLIERRGETIDAGLARLAHAAREGAHLEPDALCDHLIESVLAKPLRDDVVVLALRVVAMTPDRLTVKVPAEPGSLRSLRARLRAWLGDADIPRPLHADVLLAAGEACANAVEHAYAGRSDGHLEMVVEREDADVLVTVRDSGRWRPPTLRPDRGRGLEIIRRLSDVMDATSDQSGTTIVMRFAIGRRVDHGWPAP